MKDKKLVSYCLFAYNEENYIQASIHGALKQTYSPLEIIISDDCSTDSTYDIILKTIKSYNGPHKIIVNRNETNLGIGGHVSKICNSIANGEYLIIIGGDDISKEKHVEQAVDNFEKYPEVSLMDFSAEIIDEEGKEIRQVHLEYDYKKFTIDDYIRLKRIQSFAPGRILSKELIRKFNPISDNCPTEDSVFVFRSLLAGGFIRANLSLTQYRKHKYNISNSTGIRKIQHNKIIVQYIKDLIQFYEEDKISNDNFEILLKRLMLELQIRKINYTNNKKLIEILVKVKIRYLKLTYFLKEFISTNNGSSLKTIFQTYKDNLLFLTIVKKIRIILFKIKL